MNRKVSRRRQPVFEFVRGPGTPKGETRLLLYIDGEEVDAPATNAKILAYLHRHRGKVVPVERLCELFGYPLPTRAERLILHQYANRIRRLLDEHGAPYRLAVAYDFGYALCEIAPEERRE